MSSPDSPEKAPPATVLIVDDDDAVRSATGRLLRSHGYDAQGVASGVGVAEALTDREVDCVLLDLEMPEVDGLEVQSRMTVAGVDSPVVFLSGHADVDRSVRAMKAGALDFLVKPVDAETLLGAVGQAVDLHRERMRTRRSMIEARERLALLTPREAQVLRLVAAGLRNREVAERLGISELTVKVHRGRITRKLGARSVPDLMRVLSDSERAAPDPDARRRVSS